MENDSAHTGVLALKAAASAARVQYCAFLSELNVAARYVEVVITIIASVSSAV